MQAGALKRQKQRSNERNPENNDSANQALFCSAIVCGLAESPTSKKKKEILKRLEVQFEKWLNV